MLPEVPGLARAEIAARANAFVRAWAPVRAARPGPFPLVRVFEDLPTQMPGVITGVDDLASGVEGACYPDGRVFLSEDTYRRLIRDEGRARFTTAHEIGHACLHRHFIRRVLTEGIAPSFKRRDGMKPYLNPEWQANVFASCVLMPAVAMKVFAAEYAANRIPTLTSFQEAVRDTFLVSYEAAGIRISEMTRAGHL